MFVNIEKSKRKQYETSLFINANIIAEEIIQGEGPDAKAFFAVYDGEKITLQNAILLEDYKAYVPIPVTNQAILEGAIKLPDGIDDFETVEGLIEDIKKHLHKYIDVSPEYEEISAWYIVMTWIFDKLNTLSYLRTLGDFGTGKSRFLDVVGDLCYKPIKASGAITSAPIFRLIKRWNGTFLIDESDWKDDSEYTLIVKILNCGFERNRPIIRCNPNNAAEIEIFPTFGPKILATRRPFTDQALESRCLTETMIATSRKDIPPVLPKDFYNEQAHLRRQLLMFRFKYYRKIDQSDVDAIKLDDSIEPRLKQANISFAVIFKNIPEMFERFVNFLRKYQTELVSKRSETYEGLIARAIYEMSKADPATSNATPPFERDQIITPTCISDYIRRNFGED